jgi:hypothetical protein
LIVIDDQLLLAVLGAAAPDDISAAVANGQVFTTGCRCYRLGRAIAAGTGTGALSGRFQALDDSVRQHVLASMEDLPEQIELLSLRIVVPVMQALAVTRPVNFLNAEALGAALLLDASIAVRVDAPLLRAGAADLSVYYRIID